MKQQIAEYAKGTKEEVCAFLGNGRKLHGTIMETDDTGFLISRDGALNAVDYTDCTIFLNNIEVLEVIEENRNTAMDIKCGRPVTIKNKDVNNEN